MSIMMVVVMMMMMVLYLLVLTHCLTVRISTRLLKTTRSA